MVISCLFCYQIHRCVWYTVQFSFFLLWKSNKVRLLSSQFVSQWDVNVLLHHVCVCFWRRGFNWDLIWLQHLITWPVNPLLFHHVWHLRYYVQHSRAENSMTCLFFPLSHFLHKQFLWVGFSAVQQTLVYLFSPVKQSADANSHSFSCSASGWNTRTTPVEFLTSQHRLPLLYIV